MSLLNLNFQTKTTLLVVAMIAFVALLPTAATGITTPTSFAQTTNLT